MSILKYKDPKTGEFKRINPYKAELSFVGKDGITIDKAEDSEKIEISGSGCVQKVTTTSASQRVYAIQPDGTDIILNLASEDMIAKPGAIPQYKKINYIGKVEPTGAIITATPQNDYQCTNKKYVDDNFANKIKFTNLEQALYGYILDTTKEAYVDLDSAVLKNSVAVGDNVYPIADKTRALVTRVEGKTTKMVQLLDKSTYYGTSTNVGITATNNGDGSWTINGTATKAGYIQLSPALSLEGGHKVLLLGNKLNSAFILALLNQDIIDNGNGGVGNINAENAKTWGISWRSGAVINNVTITPQLFDLTAMNREDITTVEQFKAEFPDFYPYENGNIYPAKISGVKFYEKQDKSGEQASVTLPETYNLHGIGDYKDYLEITKNEDNDLYTLKKVQSVGVHEYTGNEAWVVGSDNMTSVFRYYCTDIIISKSLADKGICNKYATLTSIIDKEGVIFGSSNNYIYLFLNKTNFHDINSVKSYLSAQYAGNNPVVIYYRLSSPVETVIATNLTYEQVTAIRHNGGLIEVEGNTNKGYARPTVTNTIVYRLTATNTAEG